LPLVALDLSAQSHARLTGFGVSSLANLLHLPRAEWLWIFRNEAGCFLHGMFG